MIGAKLDDARCKTQIDIGYGDAVTPGPVQATYPTLLDDLPAPQLRTYPIYSVVAEKFHAIALLGMVNTRVKDYFDLYVIFSKENLNPKTLAQALKATFARREMEFPASPPIGLSNEFSSDPSRQALWHTFIHRNDLPFTPLDEVVFRLRSEFEKIVAM